MMNCGDCIFFQSIELSPVEIEKRTRNLSGALKAHHESELSGITGGECRIRSVPVFPIRDATEYCHEFQSVEFAAEFISEHETR